MLITKGYGISVGYINKSCPTDLQPYVDAYALGEKKKDESNWILGVYVRDAILSSIGNSEWFRGKNAELHEYPKEPLLSVESKGDKELSEAEKQMEVDRFFAQEAARRANWKRNKKIKGSIVS